MTVVEPLEPKTPQAEMPAPEPSASNGSEASPPKFATRADARAVEGVSKGKLMLLGGGLAVAVLFFVFTAVVGKSPKKVTAVKPPSQQAKQEQTTSTKSSVTPVMDVPRAQAPDNTSGQLGPSDIQRTRSLDDRTNAKPFSAKPAVASSLGSVPSFADTQQKWEDPAPYNGAPPAEAPSSQQNTLKEPSLIFVRSQAQNQTGITPKMSTGDDGAPQLEVTPGTRIQAKLETQISSAVQAPVVAVVEYTYAIGDRIVVPAGARVYGQLQQADRSGLVSVKFDEIELLDGAREKIDAVGTGLDLGPIKGNVYGRNTGKNFLVRAASGLGSVLAEVAGNNSSAAFSEDDMLRERLAENIGTAGDSEVMNLDANSRVVVSVPADTKIYVVFTKHEQSPAEFHKVTPVAQ
jgi:type IV secretory pathway VirB10-like protein